MTLRPNSKYPNPTPKYLRDGNTGYVYIYSDKLFDKGGFHPCNEIPNDQLPPEKRKAGQEPTHVEVLDDDLKTETKTVFEKGLDVSKGLISGAEEKSMAQMNIDELLVFAKKNYGADIDPQVGIDAVRKEVVILQTASQQEGDSTE